MKMCLSVAAILLCLFAEDCFAAEQCVVGTATVKDPKTGEVSETQTLICWDDGDTRGGWDGGWEPGYGGDPTGQYCTMLQINKPDDCLGPEPIEGANNGENSYVLGSGLYAAIHNLTNPEMAPQTRILLANALTAHTANLANGRIPFDSANQELLRGVQQACDYETAYDRAYYGGSQAGWASDSMKACLGTLSRLSGEAGISFGSFFADWLHQQGIVLADLGIPQTIINWFAPENSLRTKLELVDPQTKCNVWYKEMIANGC